MLAFICSADNPIGKVKHYFWRREYQQRGMVHFHLLIWIEGAPKLGESSDSEVAAFVQEYVTCAVPEKNKSPTLYERVTRCQRHVHNSYCLRKKKLPSTKTTAVCRFGFPRQITDSFVLRNVQTSVSGRRNLKSNSRLYDLPRKRGEAFINDYSPIISKVWIGNMDIQYVGDNSTALTIYLTKYILKPEKGSEDNVFQNVAASDSLCRVLWNIAMRMLSYRECGAMEAADTCLGYPLYGTDQETVIKWVNVFENRNKKLKPYRELQNLEDESTNIFYPNLVDDYYADRPHELGMYVYMILQRVMIFKIMNRNRKRLNITP